MRVTFSFEAFLITSLTVGALILTLWLLSPLMRKRYAANWRVLCWCLLAVRHCCGSSTYRLRFR